MYFIGNRDCKNTKIYITLSNFEIIETEMGNFLIKMNKYINHNLYSVLHK